MVQQDPEAEVRTVAAHHVANFSKHVPQEVITDQVRVRRPCVSRYVGHLSELSLIKSSAAVSVDRVRQRSCR
jgi:hypothetical protein|eukprot:COSAG06_NODE_2817_length_6234_cov_9.629177_7_plen_72_part_00